MPRAPEESPRADARSELVLTKITDDGHDPQAVERILRELPEWFGFPGGVEGYTESAGRLQNFLAFAVPPGVALERVVGVALVERHFPASAEILLLAVERKFRNAGIGRRLIRRVEEALRLDGVRLLSLKTLGPSSPDPSYGETREFYRAVGYEPLEEIYRLWGESPCLIMVKVLERGAAAAEAPGP